MKYLGLLKPRKESKVITIILKFPDSWGFSEQEELVAPLEATETCHDSETGMTKLVLCPTGAEAYQLRITVPQESHTL